MRELPLQRPSQQDLPSSRADNYPPSLIHHQGSRHRRPSHFILPQHSTCPLWLLLPMLICAESFLPLLSKLTTRGFPPLPCLGRWTRPPFYIPAAEVLSTSFFRYSKSLATVLPGERPASVWKDQSWSLFSKARSSIRTTSQLPACRQCVSKVTEKLATLKMRTANYRNEWWNQPAK